VKTMRSDSIILTFSADGAAAAGEMDGDDPALANRVRDALTKRRDGLIKKQWREGGCRLARLRCRCFLTALKDGRHLTD